MQKLAVIGYPISHSLSPKIHSAVLGSIGESFTYEKTEVKPGNLKEFLDYAIPNLDGFNLTMPHKVDIIPFLDELSEEAETYSSVNTVKIKNGKLYGYNSDADGYVASLHNKGVTPEGKRVLILGAGGVVRTLAKKLSLCGAKKIVILNRTEEKAEEIASRTVGGDFGKLEYDTIAENCKTSDILINATPLGMEGCDGDFESTEFLKSLKHDAIVSDLIYAPQKTKLLKDAESLGLKIMNGLDMLIFQAIISDSVYLERNLDLRQIYDNVIQKIKE